MSFLLCVLSLLAAPEAVLQGRSATEEASFSPDGKLLLTLAWGGAILWDVASGEELRSLRGPIEGVNSARISPDGKQAATATWDQTVRIWDLRTGATTRVIELQEHDPTRDAVFSPDGKTLAVGSFKSLKLFDLTAPGKPGRDLHAADADRIFFSPDGQRIAVASDSEMTLFEAASGKPGAVLRGSQGTMSLDGTKLAAYDEELGGIWVADGDGGAKRLLLANLPNGRGLGSARKPWRLALSADGRTLAATAGGDDGDGGSADNALLLLDTATGAEKLRCKTAAGLHQAATFSPDGRLVYHEGDLLDAATCKLVRRFQGRAQPTFGTGFSADGARLTILQKRLAPRSHPRDDLLVLRTWDLATLRPIATLQERRDLDTWRPPQFLADGKRVLVTSLPAGYRHTYKPPPDRDSGRLWDLESGKLVRSFPGIFGSFGASFSRDGRLFATARFDDPRVSVKLVDAQSGKVLRSVTDKHRDGDVHGIALSPDGKRVAYRARKNTLALWEPATGRQRIVDLTPDDTRLAAGARHETLEIWDETTGQKTIVDLPPAQSSVKRAGVMVFSPDGRLLAVVSGNELVLIDVAQAKELRRMRALRGADLYDTMNSVAFSPDGKLVAAGCHDATAHLWEVATGASLQTLVGHTEEVRGVSFSPDGKLLATSGDQSVRLWNPATGELLVTLVSTGDDDHAAIIPDGHYLASRGAARDLHFSKDFSIIPFQGVDLILHRPDLVIARTGRAEPTRVASLKRAWLKRLQLVGLREEQLGGDLHLPGLELLREPPLESTERTLAIAVRVFDSAFKLDRINVSVNAVPVFGAQGVSLREPATQDATKAIQLELSEGINRIDLSALNEKGVESLRHTFAVNYSGPKRAHALTVVAIGVSDHGRPAFNLTQAAKDARDLAAQLEELGRKGFGRVEKIELLDGDATREKILAVREKLAATQVDDEVVLFVAGRGLLDDKLDDYFGTAYIDFDHPAGRGLAYEQLEGLLAGIPARRKLLLMDTCAVGTRGFERKGTLPLDESLDAVFADLRRSSGAVVISSAGGAGCGLESSAWKNGVFTAALVSGLRSRAADLDQDGVIRASELREYAARKVAELTSGKRRPTARPENLEWDFTVE